ncbi:CcmD family protein [Melioribacter sp. Ez-97]|uniref:CcmD family protein n=1 Tax=Melioribacter sp. Ez-97 TaxID=3423434 RepID=UPI003EDAE4C8
MENGLLSFFEKNSIYIVMFIVLVVWFGIFLFLNNTDKKLKVLENELKEKYNE